MEYKSAIAKAKRILVAAGFPWSTTTGRYQPYNHHQRTTFGVRVTRVGCSDTVSVSVWGGALHPSLDETSRAMHLLAIAALRDAGMPFDDRGWLDCRETKKTTPK